MQFIGAVFSFRKKRSKNDPYSTLLLQAITILMVQFNINLKIVHIKRCSNEYSVYADALTRSDLKGVATAYRFKDRIDCKFPVTLQNWLTNPRLDSMLGLKLYEEIKSSLND